MNHPIFRRGLSLMLALALALALGLTANALDTDGLCEHHPSHTADCGYIESKICKFAVEGCPDCKDGLVELTADHVTLTEGSDYDYTGQEIKPAVTVAVSQTVLTEEEHYTLTYANNIEPGTGTILVTGVEEKGFKGSVIVPFTIVKEETPTDPSEETEPDEETEPSEETKPEEKPDYKITKGNGSKWRRDSKKNLSFTVNADARDITGIEINGKTLSASNYTLGKDGLVTLKNDWLQKQALGTYRITLKFADGDAEGKFTVAAAADPSNPSTGDTIGLWIGIMTVSLGGFAALALLKKRFT